jgi:hypothetical protein
MFNPPNLPARILLAVASVLMAFATFTTRADYSNTVASFNPLAYWRFNEATASGPLNKSANATALGSVIDGYVSGDAVVGEPGIVGNAVRTINNGVVAGWDYGKVDVPYNAALNKSGAFTLEFWAKPNALGADTTGMAVVSSLMNDFAASSRRGYLVYINNTGRVEFRLGNVNGYVGTVNTGNSALNAVVGQWRHIVCVFDGATNRVYLNGVLSATLALTASQIAGLEPNSQVSLRVSGTAFNGSLSDGPWVSALGTSGNRAFDGWVDELAYYSHALNGNEIAAHFSAATTNTAGYSAQILAANPTGYWPFNESAFTPGSGVAVANSGSLGSGANGTTTNGALTAQTGLTGAGFGANNRNLFLDGVSGRVAVGNDAGLNISGNITLMAWVKPTFRNAFRDIIAHGWDENYAETALRISRGGANGGYGDGNYYEVGVTDGVPSTYNDVAQFAIPGGDFNNWVFLAGTYDGSSWKLYRNGALVASTASTNGPLAMAAPWSIGARNGPPSPTSFFTGQDFNYVFNADGCFFGGGVDEPAIFGSALSAANINTLWQDAQVPPYLTRAVQAPATAFRGSSLDLSVWAEGSGTLSYLWRSNGVALGVTTTNITINNLQDGAQAFSVEVTSAYGAVTSSVSVAVSAAPPTISAQPQSVSRYAGLPFSFSVTAQGTQPLSYQWYKDGGVIGGATSPTYGGTAAAGLAGAYTVVISNETGVVITSTPPAVLTVIPAPTGYGGAVLASAPIAYYRLGEASGTVANDYISGINGTYFNATLGQPGYASDIDPDTAVAFSGNADSYVGSISGTAINFQGTTTSFTLECWANGPDTQASDAALIAKGTGASGTTANEQFVVDVVGGKYHFFLRRPNGNVAEATAGVGPDGTWQHIVAVYDHTTLTLTLYVNGSESGSGQNLATGLRVSNHPVSIGSKRSGNAPTYDNAFSGSIDEVAFYNTALSSATVQSHYAAAYGSNLRPQISKQPVNVTNYVSLPVTLLVGAYGTVPLSFQWVKAGLGDIPGATSSSYTINAVDFSDAGTYSVRISNSLGTTNSASATVTVLSAPTTAPAIPGLVMHLPFDNNLNDVTGRGNNGVGIHRVQNLGVISSNVAAPSYVTGALGQGLHFVTTFLDTTETNIDATYVMLGDRADFRFSSNVNFTVAFWVKNTDAIAAQWGDLPFVTTTTTSTFDTGLAFAWTYGRGDTPYIGGWAWSMYDTGGNGVGGRGAQGSIDDGNWHHLVHTFDRQSGQNVNYLDGRVVAFNKQAGSSVAAAENIDTGNPLTIGQTWTGAYGEAGSGAIDDLLVFKKVLTPLEAASIYMAGISNGLSVVSAPFSLTSTRTGNTLTLTWDVGVLQQATNVTGPYTDVPGASSPLTVVPSGQGKYYRIRL